MAKHRKKRTSPNISDEAIERARQQLGETEETDQPAETKTKEGNGREQESRQRRRRRERSGLGQSEVVQYSKVSKRKNEGLDSATIVQMLAHPTKFVTEEELRADYHHVITDLRNMAILSAFLMVVLVVLGQFI